MTSEILTPHDIAEYLKVSEKTIYRLLQREGIPAFKVGGAWRFRRVDIDEWIRIQTPMKALQHNEAAG